MATVPDLNDDERAAVTAPDLDDDDRYPRAPRLAPYDFTPTFWWYDFEKKGREAKLAAIKPRKRRRWRLRYTFLILVAIDLVVSIYFWGW